MDEERFDRWTRGVQERISRRGLSGIAAGALDAIGLAASVDAKKKKKKKKRKKKNLLPPVPPAPPPPPPSQCINLRDNCVSGSDTCCTYNTVNTAPICATIDPGDPNATECCFRSGTRASEGLASIYCCGLGFDWDNPGTNLGPGTCCVDIGRTPLPGETAEHCCKYHVTNDAGKCCVPSGAACDNMLEQLCCDGSICPISDVCP